MSEATCRCGHPKGNHRAWKGRCMSFEDGLSDPFVPAAETWVVCSCVAFDDAALPADGERLEFGRHRLRSVEAETAEAWPPLPSVAKRRASGLIARLRALR